MDAMEVRGKVVRSETYAEGARICFMSDDENGTDILRVIDGVLYIYRSGKIFRISSTFDVEFCTEQI